MNYLFTQKDLIIYDKILLKIMNKPHAINILKKLKILYQKHFFINFFKPIFVEAKSGEEI